MNEESLSFPDHRRSELESTIGELLDRAQMVLNAQGRLRSLLQASRSVVTGLELPQVLRHIAEAAVTLVDAQYGALGVVDRDGRLEQFIHVGMPEDTAALIGDLPEGHGILGAVIQSETPIRLDDLGADPRSAGFPPNHPPMRTFLGVPIRVRGEIYGNLYLTNRVGGTFTDEDEELVLALASTAGIAIDNARRYEETRRLQRLSSSLAEVTAALLSPDSADAFGVVAERVGVLIEADLVCLVVSAVDEEEGYRIEAARGAGAQSIEGAELPGDHPLVSRAMQGGIAMGSGGILDASVEGDPGAGGSTIAVPLVVAGEPSGALCASRAAGGPRFSSDDLSTLSEFAAQAGLALALARARADRHRLDVIEDRARIARDLHDTVIQRLFGAGLGLQALAASLPTHAAAILAHVDAIDAAIADFRTAIFSLQTSPGDSVRHRVLDVVTDLTPSLAAMPRLAFDGPIDLLVTGVIADDVVAVVREALSNVARHAQAATVEVSVSATPSEVTVTVRDDGKGMPDGPSRSSGTANLAARARNHGGAFVIESGSTGGVLVRWRVPLVANRPDPH
ncbi:GAF domain-containing protein [Microbacterium sp. NPDC012755]|uniref:GAF domain-containing sensor histidine kinase n=1 Tax=Microbacterium sp. NPDC012755 TaxID=3364184 RepID=UPI0036BCF2B1